MKKAAFLISLAMIFMMTACEGKSVRYYNNKLDDRPCEIVYPEEEMKFSLEWTNKSIERDIYTYDGKYPMMITMYSYPEFSGESEAVQEINRGIRDFLNERYRDSASWAQNRIGSFDVEYSYIDSETGENRYRDYNKDELEYKVEYCDENLLSIRFNQWRGVTFEFYPRWDSYAVNFDLNTGKKINVNDLFNDSKAANAVIGDWRSDYEFDYYELDEYKQKRQETLDAYYSGPIEDSGIYFSEGCLEKIYDSENGLITAPIPLAELEPYFSDYGREIFEGISFAKSGESYNIIKINNGYYFDRGYNGLPKGIDYFDNKTIRQISLLRDLDNLSLNSFMYDYDTEKVTDISPLKNCKKLEYLDISGTRIDDCSALSGLPLKELDLSGTEIKDFSPLKGLPLEELYISDTKAIDCEFVKELPELETLVLTGAAIEDLSPLNGREWELLILNRMRKADFFTLDNISVKSLCMEDNIIEDVSFLENSKIAVFSIDCFGNCTGFENLSIKALEINGNPGKGLDEICRMKGLERVSFLEGSVTDEEADRLREALPECEVKKQDNVSRESNVDWEGYRSKKNRN